MQIQTLWTYVNIQKKKKKTEFFCFSVSDISLVKYSVLFIWKETIVFLHFFFFSYVVPNSILVFNKKIMTHIPYKAFNSPWLSRVKKKKKKTTAVVKIYNNKIITGNFNKVQIILFCLHDSAQKKKTEKPVLCVCYLCHQLQVQKSSGLIILINSCS